VDLTNHTVSNTKYVPTFMDNLYKQGSISTEILGVSFQPEFSGDANDTNGELTIGGSDSSKYHGSITYVDAVAPYWGVDNAGFTYGSTPLSSNGSGIVDTGTTLIYLPTDVFNAFRTAAGAMKNSTQGLPTFSSMPTENFEFNLGPTTYALTPDQYLIPEAQYTNLGLPSGFYYGWFSDGGNSGVNTIIGQKFMENYYAVFDTTHSRIGFAPAA
jgi:hypothetical protein